MQPVVTLWAKLGHETWPARYHPLVCHLIDVAHVAGRLWDRVVRPRVRAWVGGRLGLSEGDAGRWLAFWAGAHDIGKACPGFQVLGDDRTARLKSEFPTPPWDYPLGKTPPHGDLGVAILAAELADGSGFEPLPKPTAQRIAIAVGGHHGRFCPDWNGKTWALGGRPWAEVRRGLLTELARQVGVSGLPAPSPAGDAGDNPVWMYLAGLTSVADWIGSNQQFFPPHGNPDRAAAGFSIDDYSRQAAGQADRALEALGWLGRADDAAPRSFRQLFPEIERPRPLQDEIERVAGAMTGPTLVIVEAPMGEGKTEAAWYVADRWDRLGGQGCYVALPTMATSNQMFDRAKGFLATRAGKSNVQLLHGKAQLNELFGALKYQAYVYDEDRDPTAVVAEGWFAANKKHGLLAPFGVGTIDQSLLAVLQTKHVFVRLFGLAGKCVILDEVHAYDAYMTTLLERLLQWLAALGCPVVLLSATLPADRRLRLLRAYAGAEAPVPDRVDYPRITTAGGGNNPAAVHVAADKDRARTVALEWVSEDAFVDRLADALKGGGCACVIRNTVGLAQETYLRLKEALPADVTVELFHARFPFGQRRQIEDAVLARFGKAGGLAQRHKRVLVATQVVEQSLDLDFDLMVSDVAPADLVLQRAGRLWRHNRPARGIGLASAALWLIRPHVDGDGVPVFGKPGIVYDTHVLFRSWRALKEPRAGVRLPDDIDPLVDEVYRTGPPPADLTPPELAFWDETLAKQIRTYDSETDQAQSRQIKMPRFNGDFAAIVRTPREEENPDLHPAFQALTRLTGPTAQLICLESDGARGHRLSYDGTPVPSLRVRLMREGGIADVKHLMLGEIGTSHIGLVRALWDGAAGRRIWPDVGMLARHYFIEFTAGRAVVGCYELVLDQQLGLRVQKADAGEGDE